MRRSGGAWPSIPLIGALNLGVSFYFAFRLALQAHNVSRLDRARIRVGHLGALAQPSAAAFSYPDKPAAFGLVLHDGSA